MNEYLKNNPNMIVPHLLEDDYWGIGSVIAIFTGLGASIASWITWGLMLLLK